MKITYIPHGHFHVNAMTVDDSEMDVSMFNNVIRNFAGDADPIAKKHCTEQLCGNYDESIKDLYEKLSNMQ